MYSQEVRAVDFPSSGRDSYVTLTLESSLHNTATGNVLAELLQMVSIKCKTT